MKTLNWFWWELSLEKKLWLSWEMGDRNTLFRIGSNNKKEFLNTWLIDFVKLWFCSMHSKKKDLHQRLNYYYLNNEI